MIERLLDLISPHRCSVCGENGQILCESCKYDIINEPYEGCLVCQAPVGPRGICNKCRRKLPIDQAWCVGERTGGLKRLGDGYKFKSQRAGAVALAELLDEIIPVLSPAAVIMPIPTSPSTIRVRGFDHMRLITLQLAKQRGLHTDQFLERTTKTTLHFLGRVEREKLGPSLFELKPGVSLPEHIVLIDDIVTTGTTLRAATKILKQAGVQRIDVAVIARQPFDK